MPRYSSLLLTPVAVITLAAATLIIPTYEIADDYAVRFDTRGAEGTFSELEGSIAFDPDDLPGSRFDVSVAAATIETGNDVKDGHARGENRLNAEAHPRIRFASRAFAKTAEGYDVTGDLTLRGVTEEVTIPFTFEGDVFAGSLTVDREVLRRTGVGAPALSWRGRFCSGGWWAMRWRSSCGCRCGEAHVAASNFRKPLPVAEAAVWAGIVQITHSMCNLHTCLADHSLVRLY